MSTSSTTTTASTTGTATGTTGATDPITVAVIASALRATAWEMGEALRRSSHSPIIREMYDYSCGVFTAAGETVAQDELIPAFLGTMAATMPFVIAEGGTPSPGDVLMTNDPYRGGTHTPDIQLFLPLFADDELVGWCGNIAHHSDVGGTNPGTEGFANRSIFEEGLRIPPLKLYDAGTLNEPLLRMIDNNVRDPRSTAGDLRAQIASARIGARRVQELIDRYGGHTVAEAMDEVLAQSERRLRAALAACADGEARAEGFLDDDGVGGGPVAIRARVAVEQDRVVVDLTGTDPQMAGGMNMSVTAARCAVAYAVKATFDPDAPHNGGVFRAIETVLPEGSLANPRFPAAVSLRHLAAQRTTDTILRAFGALYPERATADAFVGFSSLAASCRHPRTGEPVVIQDDLGGGTGAHDGGDGLDAVDTYLGNVQLLPAEIAELQYPVRIVETALLPDSAGAGRYRGGLGIRRTYEFLDEVDAIVYSEQTRPEHAARGLQGGHAAAPAQVELHRADGTVEPIGKGRVAGLPGDRLVVATGGGGGYGDPCDRDPAAVERDVREGKVTPETAAAVYGFAPAG